MSNEPQKTPDKRTRTPSGSSEPRSPRSPVPMALLLDPSSPEYQRAVAGQEKLQKMILAHEVFLNKEFQVQDVLRSPSPGSLEAKLSEMMHQAFWDNLRRSLEGDPPDHEYALRLLEEIRQTLVNLLPKGENSAFAQQISSVLDIDKIRSQIQDGHFDLKQIARFITDTMAKLCAPARDEEVAALRKTDDIVTLFKEVFHVLQEMKLDMINFALAQVKPFIDKHATEYELQMFEEYLNNQGGSLDNTRSWLKRTAERLLSEMSSTASTSSNSNSSLGTDLWRITPMNLLRAAFLDLLTSDVDLPETFISDFGRIAVLRDRVQCCTLVSSVYLVSTSVPKVLSLPKELVADVRRLISVRSEDGTIDFPSLAEYVVAKVQESSPNVLKDAAEELKRHLTALSDENNPVRRLLTKRLREFIGNSLWAAASNIPVGLSVVSEEIVLVTQEFARIVSRNQQVFGGYYSKLINEVADELHLRIAPSPQQPAT